MRGEADERKAVSGLNEIEPKVVPAQIVLSLSWYSVIDL
jgi:hypothetical protein